MAYVFQDCKDDPLPQADTLLDRVEVGVEEVRPDDMSLVLVKPVTLLPDVSVVVDGKVLDVVAHSDDQVWTTSVEGIQPGQWLTQERAVSSDAEILSRFAAAWGARWLKLDHVLPSQWQQIWASLNAQFSLSNGILHHGPSPASRRQFGPRSQRQQKDLMEFPRLT